MPSLLSAIRLLFVLIMVCYAAVEAIETNNAAETNLVQAVSTPARSVRRSDKVAKPGCRDRCGNVSIPYPFGMDSSNCYRDSGFKITCNHSSGTPVAFLDSWLHRQYEVLQITLDYVRVRVSAAPTVCGLLKFSNTLSSEPFLHATPFTISDTGNKLVVLGCNIYGYIIPLLDIVNKFDDSETHLESGCATGCQDSNPTYYSYPSRTCGSGYSCCNTTIPKGLKGNLIRTNGFGQRDDGKNVSCIRAFLVDQAFPWFDIYGFEQEDNKEFILPVILDWAIVDFTTCEQAQTYPFSETRRHPREYACGRNTYCQAFHNGPGYSCKCLKGYEGNPYLLHGCQDVDECKEVNKCGKELICVNTPGSYKCGCSTGKKLGITKLGYQYCTPNKTRFRIAVSVSSGIGVTIVMLVILGMGYWLRKRFEKRKKMKLKKSHFTRNGGLLLKQKIASNDGRVEKAAKIFVTEELEKTTDNFNPSRIIGKGGFGTVYKGMLSNGEIVAIKKSTLVDETQIDQFINEVVILSQINHRHIVKLLGCCLETEVPLLVYEFVPNGTLSYHLQVEQQDGESLLSWKDRVRIAYEIAGALAYLHSDAAIPIFHRDIKSTNILLDENLHAKVSDFGISRSIPIEKTHLTTRVQGTFGYLDPEYFRSSQFTDKSDVYSFGVVLVELLTGERAISKIRHEEEKGLALYFINSMKEDRLSETLDARVLNEGEIGDVLVVAKLAKRCLKYVGKKRPSMKEVSLSLGALHEKLSRDPLPSTEE